MTRVALAGVLVLVACGGGDGGGDDDGGHDGGGTRDAAAADAAGEPGGDAGQDAGAECGREIFAGAEAGTARAIAVDDVRVYAVTGVTGTVQVWSIDRRGGEAELLGTLPLDRADRVRVDDESLYVAGSTPGYEGLFRVAKDAAGEPERLSADPVSTLAVDATHVYWVAFDPPPGAESAIKRRAKAGGEEELFVQGEAEIGFDAQLAVVGGHVYWNHGIHLRRRPTAGGPVELFDYLGPQGADSGCEFCLDEMVVADGQLYWFDRADRTFFYRAGAAAFQRELLAADSSTALSNDTPIFVLDGHIYWSAWSVNGAIGLTPTAGGETDAITTDRVVIAFYPAPEGIYVGGLSGQVDLVPLDGCR